MTQWKMTTAATLAGLMFVAPAFAQAAMGGDEKVKAAQQALKDKGLDPGTVDGKMGPKTEAALRDFQKAQGMQATGRLDSKTVQSLGMDGAKGESATAPAPKDAAGSGSPATGAAGEKKKY